MRYNDNLVLCAFVCLLKIELIKFTLKIICAQSETHLIAYRRISKLIFPVN